MPFKSEAQRRFMYAKHPKIAKRWEKHTKKKKLPERVNESFMSKLSKALKEGTDKRLWKIYIPGFTDTPKYTHAYNTETAIKNIIAKEFKNNNRIFKNRVYSSLDYLITAIIGPSHARHSGNVQFEVIKKE